MSTQALFGMAVFLFFFFFELTWEDFTGVPLSWRSWYNSLSLSGSACATDTRVVVRLAEVGRGVESTSDNTDALAGVSRCSSGKCVA